MVGNDLVFEKSKDNYDIVKINKDNKWIYIGSKYNMNREIQKFLDKVEDEEYNENTFLIYGFALGEHVKALRKKYKNNKIIVFEPIESLFKEIEKMDWVKKDTKLEIINCEKELVLKKIEENIDEFNIDCSKFAIFSTYEKIYAKEIFELLKEIKDYYINLRVERNTKIKYSKRWFDTLIDNFKYMLNGVPADVYMNKYKNRPAIIVSAGPSLEKNIDLLKEVKNKMIIMSGGRTLKGLIDKSITPDLVAVIDQDQKSYNLVENYIDKVNCPLLFWECTNEEIVKHHKGEKIFSSHIDFLSKVTGMKMRIIPTGGSVAHNMASYAAMLGCNPVIFIGQDLAYTNEKSYSSMSENRDGTWKFDEVKSDEDLWVEDVNGEKVRTSISLDLFRKWFEKMIDETFTETTFINATEGGARIKGTIEMSLKDVISKYNPETTETFFEKIDYAVDMMKNAREELEKTKKSVNILIKKCNEAIGYIDKLEIEYAKNNKIQTNILLKKLDTVDEVIKKEYISVDIIQSLLYPIIYSTLTGKATSDKRPSIKESKYISDENRKLYNGILEQLKYANKCLEKINYIY
ncbi:motility associated factor glycosyltransferase family protein [Clostridium butyricum]|uniref:motility associated factor glycosyltransferase family protein n=2 Tax=Clostridium butyricum TaxID=1492 RepID=UPI0013D0035B|nr:6-hydroxymethylpterin diphosphokinase MptE-like protein [Clostridium butyricum]NFB70118.1 DUF115 domain-containing protein [Clostridium butyricum]NFB89905.1 DUF115 domain-containing protein [Clostridium butyricum]